MIITNQTYLKEELFMSVVPKELVRDFVKEQRFTNTDKVLSLLK